LEKFHASDWDKDYLEATCASSCTGNRWHSRFAFPTGHEKIALETKKDFRHHHLGQLIHLQQTCGVLLVIAENIFP
jgi:hypothetical protein